MSHVEMVFQIAMEMVVYQLGIGVLLPYQAKVYTMYKKDSYSVNNTS